MTIEDGLWVTASAVTLSRVTISASAADSSTRKSAAKAGQLALTNVWLKPRPTNLCGALCFGTGRKRPVDKASDAAVESQQRSRPSSGCCSSHSAHAKEQEHGNLPRRTVRSGQRPWRSDAQRTPSVRGRERIDSGEDRSAQRLLARIQPVNSRRKKAKTTERNAQKTTLREK